MAELIDCSPRLEVNEGSVFERVERERERIYQLLSQELDAMGKRGEVTMSRPYEFEASVLVRLWRSEGDSQYRGYALITVRPMPGHRHDVVFEIQAESGGKTRRVHRVLDIPQSAARALLEFISDPTKKLPGSAFTRHGLVLGRNRIMRRPGQLAHRVRNAAPVLGGMLFIVRPEVGVIGFLLGAGFLFFTRGRERVISEGRPVDNPRKLQGLDYWQTVLIGIGHHADSVLEGVKAELNTGIHPDARLKMEEVAYLSRSGRRNRQQLVVTFRRAVAFVEIHGYGDDLYVDWEAYLNRGVWSETEAGMGYDMSGMHSVRYLTVTAQEEPFNEYDLSDANFLIEWLHACVTKVLRRFVKEYEIDQEIDFKILREGRESVRENISEKSAKKKRGFSRID